MLAGGAIAGLGGEPGATNVRVGSRTIVAAPVTLVAAAVTGAGPLLDFTSGPGWVMVQAPAGTQGGVREVFWYSDATPALNAETCATWTVAQGKIVQHGAALRVADRDGVLHAITVTRNIFGGSTWVFNVHVWSGSQGRLVGQFDLASVFKENATASAPFPWRLCARAVGTTVEFKVWRLGSSEPDWGDPTYGGGVTLPSGWNYAGLSGWYAGHLATGDLAGFSDLLVATLRQTQRLE